MQNTPVFGKVILIGNPNVGKSTLFNHLTGKKVHTGNWSGKTVSVSEGYGIHMNKRFLFRDLPGITSLTNPTGEELAAFREIIHGDYNACIIVADANNLQKSLTLTLRILELTSRCILCINMWDEAVKNGISIDLNSLSFILGIKVIPLCARSKKGIVPLLYETAALCEQSSSSNVFTPLYSAETEKALSSFSYDRRDTLSRIYTSDSFLDLKSSMAQHTALLAHKIEKVTVKKNSPKNSGLDHIFCSPHFGIPIMLLLLAAILFMTITLSDYPSDFLSFLFKKGEALLFSFFEYLRIPDFISSFLLCGVYRTASSVVAVMLPPMVIFFPFFALLEDSGYLPRIAFNLDSAFEKCGSCGKCALTMCMGLGCNCVGIANSDIIPSKKQRLISILTNSFIPCNGRFGAIIAVISIFIAPKNPLWASFCMCLVLVFAFASSLLASFVLSSAVLKGERKPYILELPRYRKPQLAKVILSSVKEHTPSILLRAILVAAPVGGIIHILNHFSLLVPISDFLDPFAALLGLDGILLLSFILSFPANEITLPIALMLYTASDSMVEFSSYSSLFSILSQNGWSMKTVVSFLIFTLLHWPCAAAILSVNKATKSIYYTILSVVLPLVFGIFFCILSNGIFSLFVA